MSTALEIYEREARGLGCLICRRLGYGETPASLHHPRTGVGGAEKQSDWLQVPLCPEHHTGASGIHSLGQRQFERRYGVDELGLVALTVAGVMHSIKGRPWSP